jgi:SHS2 domain-containing protein
MTHSPGASRKEAGQKGQKMELAEPLELLEAEPMDLGFVIRGPSLEALFRDASEELLAATVERHDSVQNKVTVDLEMVDDTLELLLSRFLKRLIELRETRGLLLRACSIELQFSDEVGLWSRLTGEIIELGRHLIARHVKAALARQLLANPETGNWEVLVRLDA